MLASFRAELLVLRKWPAAWALLLLTPMLMLASYYVASLIQYVTLTPAEYGWAGTPAQQLPAMLPSQFVIIAVTQFQLSGVVPFIVLGAIVAGDDWGRGTIRTSLLQAPGRARTFGGQLLALFAAIAASVLVTFALAAAASLIILAIEAHAANPAATAPPSVLVMVEAPAGSLLIAITYGALGVMLGTLCRSSAGAMGIALAWTLLVEDTLYDLAVYTGGQLRTISDLTPGASAVTLTGLYGTPGGGAGSQNYEPVKPAEAVLTLACYAVAALLIALIVLRRRDVTPERARRWRAYPAASAAAGRAAAISAAEAPAPARAAPQAHAPPPAATGVLASLRAELLVMCRRPAIWALVLVLPADMLINSYLTQFVLYREANTPTGMVQGLNQQQLLASLMPHQYLTAALSGFGQFSDVYGTAIFMLVGALVGGSDWGRRTIKAALLQGPGRLRTFIGQYLAVAITLATSVAITFLLAAAASGLFAVTSSRSLASGLTSFPAPAQVASALAAGILLSLAYGAVGLTCGVLFRSAGAGIGAVLLWAVVIEPTIEYLTTQFHGVVLRIYDALPDASTNALVNLYNHTGLLFGAPVQESQVAPATAFLTLGLYAVVFLTIPAILTWRRDIL